MSQLHFQPIEGRTLDIIDAILQVEELASLSDDELNLIRLVTEELVVNVADYSGSTYLDVEVKRDGNDITLQFRDGGVPFNPLEKEEPDVTLPIEERSIGGLGIFLVTNMTDKVEYELSNGENILTVFKKFS